MSFSVYVARSGSLAKVGITGNLDARFAQYCTHNPNLEMAEKLCGVPQEAAQWVEMIAHEILGVTDNEWLQRTDAEIDEAIETAKKCVALMAEVRMKILRSYEQ